MGRRRITVNVPVSGPVSLACESVALMVTVGKAPITWAAAGRTANAASRVKNRHEQSEQMHVFITFGPLFPIHSIDYRPEIVATAFANRFAPVLLGADIFSITPPLH